MRGILVSSFAVASILSSGPIAGDAKAGPLTPASVISGSATSFVERVTNICGSNGCVRVQTQRVQHHKPGSVAAKHI
jgi:hypothetical protein